MNIRTAPATGLSTEELVLATAFLGLIVDRIREQGNDVPGSVLAEQRAADTELAERQRGDKERRLANARARREALLTAPEKRAKVEEEIAELETELGLTPEKATGTARTSSKKDRSGRK